MGRNRGMSIWNVVKFAGAYIAFVIGSGFATGQEIMQFFTIYGYGSVGAVLISMAIFSLVGAWIMGAGYEYRKEKEFSTYLFFCGRGLGTVLEYIIPVFLFGSVVIMLSGAGATLHEYYGLNHYVGCLLMAVLVLGVFLAGLSRLVDIIGLLGPIIVLFAAGIGAFTLLHHWEGLQMAEGAAEWARATRQVSLDWWVSGVLYAAYNLLSAAFFLSALGKTAGSRSEAVAGGITGGIVLMLGTLVMNLALLSDLDHVLQMKIPTLYLARQISPALGAVFSVILVAGIFSTAAPMLWTICTETAGEGNGIAKITAVVVTVGAFFCGLLPFDVLIGILYPLMGCMGIVLVSCVVWKQCGSRGMRK